MLIGVHLWPLVLCSAAAAQDLGIKAPPQTAPVVLMDATIHPVSGPELKGHLLFQDGRVTGVGMVHIPADAGWKVIKAEGLHIYPGLISPYTQLGLQEIAAVRATIDTGEVGQATPEARAVVAVNPDSTLLPVTRTNGVLCAGVFPATNLSGQTVYFDGPGGLVPGRAGVIQLDGWTWEQMTVLDDAGMVLNWPQARPIAAWWMNKSEAEQQKDIDTTLAAIDALFSGARAYSAARAADPALPTDIRFEAMRGLVGEAKEGSAEQAIEGSRPRPVFVLANDYDQIHQAVGMCVRHSLRCVIVGGRDADACADLLRRHDVGVILQGPFRFPKRDDAAYDEQYALPARLEAAGVRWCMGSGEDTPHERNLPYAAAMAVAYGLPHEAGVRSITLGAAQILGVADQLGSLETGKRATLIVTDGDVLEVTTKVKMAYIDGREIDLSNKQTKLEEKYREKYRQQKAPASAAKP